MVVSDSENKIENDQKQETNKKQLIESSPTCKVKKVRAKVDCGKRNWNKEKQNKRLLEWRMQRGFKWNQKQKETKNKIKENRYTIRVFACIRFNKCTVLYTH